MATTLTRQTDYLRYYVDPRGESGFAVECVPLCNDPVAPVPDAVAELKEQFRAVYGRRNACVRKLSALEPAARERALLIEQTMTLTEAIDHLEDVGAPIGFVAEPVMEEDMFTSRLIFTHVTMSGSKKEPSESSFSIYISIPLEGAAGKEGSDAA
jgi:hypothetical protein